MNAASRNTSPAGSFPSPAGPLATLRRRKLLVAGTTLVGVVVGLFYATAFLGPSYASTATVLVKPITPDTDPPAPDRRLQRLLGRCRYIP